MQCLTPLVWVESVYCLLSPMPFQYPTGRTAESVRERGRELEMPLVGGAMMRRLAIRTTSLPLNFFSSSRTSRDWILWNDFSSRYGTCGGRAC